MYGFDHLGISTETSASNIPAPTEKLDGKEALLRCFMYALLSVNTPTMNDISLDDEIWKNISEIANFSNGVVDGEWVCFNIETGQIGMAFPYRGEYRIRPTEVTDTQIRAAQQRRVESRANIDRSDDD